MLFVILIADLPLWMDKIKVDFLSFADDLSISGEADSETELICVLEKSAEEVLQYIKANRLAIDTSKDSITSFLVIIIFGY